MADLNELNEKVEQIKADIREQLEFRAQGREG